MNKVRRTPALQVVALVAAGLLLGRLLPVVLEWLDRSSPRVSWVAAVALLFGAAVVGAFAWNTWQSLHKRRERMTSDYGLRMLALAKSSAIVGALVAGGYGGFALAFLGDDSPLGHERFRHSLAAAIAGVLLMVAGLLLERACQIPGNDEDDDKPGNATPA